MLEVTIVPHAEVADCGGLPWSSESNTGKDEDKGSDKRQTGHSGAGGSNLRLVYLGSLAWGISTPSFELTGRQRRLGGLLRTMVLPCLSVFLEVEVEFRLGRNHVPADLPVSLPAPGKSRVGSYAAVRS